MGESWMATLWLDRLQVCKRLGNGSQLVTKADYPPTTAKHRTTVYPVYIIDQWRICQTAKISGASWFRQKARWLGEISEILGAEFR
jgi:hypothetical protein